MRYFCLSFTHKNTDLALREKLALAEAGRAEFMRRLNAFENVRESLVLSTCNRVEILAYAHELKKTAGQILKILASLAGIERELLGERVDVFEDSGAIHHLFSVASSLDSLIIGETQIAGQLREAFSQALAGGFCGVHLSRAIHQAFACAARVRNETQISKNPVSVASVAVARAGELVRLAGREVVVLGAGQMAALAARHLLAAGAGVVFINRSPTRAAALAEELNFATPTSTASTATGSATPRARAAAWEELGEFLKSHEVFFSATAAQGAIITPELAGQAGQKRYFFDLAVPRDIALAGDELTLIIAVDDLKEVVQRNLALREQEATIAYSIIGSMTWGFFARLKDLALEPAIKALRLRSEDCLERELKKALKKGYLAHCDEEEVRRFAGQLFRAFLHGPTAKLKALQGRIQSDTVVSALRFVFDLSDDLEGLGEYKCEGNFTQRSSLESE